MSAAAPPAPRVVCPACQGECVLTYAVCRICGDAEYLTPGQSPFHPSVTARRLSCNHAPRIRNADLIRDADCATCEGHGPIDPDIVVPTFPYTSDDEGGLRDFTFHELPMGS